MRKNLSAGRKGILDGPEGRSNKSLAASRRVYTTTRNQNVSSGLRGHTVSEETRRKISASRKAYNAAKKLGGA